MRHKAKRFRKEKMTAKARRPLRRWKMWASVDQAGNYRPDVHGSRRMAIEDCQSWSGIKNANFVVAKVEIRELRKRR